MLIDSHCHLFKSEYDDIENKIENMNKNGENIIVVCGYNFYTNNEVLTLIKKYKNVYGMVGYHPNEVSDVYDIDLKSLEKTINNNKIIGIGEIGLDYYRGLENKKNQKEWFIKQIEFAIKNNKPILIHSRKANNDVIKILARYNIKGIIHCFSGSVEEAQKYIDLGFLLGIGGVLTFKNSNLKLVIEKFSLENFVLETDSPYLTPDPFRGKKNEPAYVKYVALKIAEIKNMNYEDVCKITSDNFRRIFNV